MFPKPCVAEHQLVTLFGRLRNFGSKRHGWQRWVTRGGGPLRVKPSSAFGLLSASWSAGYEKTPLKAPITTYWLTSPTSRCSPHSMMDWTLWTVSQNKHLLSSLKLLASRTMPQSEPTRSRAWYSSGRTQNSQELPLFAMHYCPSLWFKWCVWGWYFLTGRTAPQNKDIRIVFWSHLQGSSQAVVVKGRGGNKAAWWIFQRLLSKMIRKHIKSLAETLRPADFTMQAMKFVAEAK